MGAKEKNFHADLYRRMGYEREVDRIGELFLAGKKAEAIAAVPDEMVAETMIVGPKEKVRDEIVRWEEAGVSMLMVTARTPDLIRGLAELV